MLVLAGLDPGWLTADAVWAQQLHKPLVALDVGLRAYRHVPVPVRVGTLQAALEYVAGSGADFEPLREPASVRVIGFCGAAGSGKDTAGRYLARQGWVALSFADALRELVLWVHPTSPYEPDDLKRPEVKNEVALPNGVTYRVLLQRLGTDIARSLYTDVWVDEFHRRLGVYRKLLVERVYVTDVRFANEAAYIRRCGGWVLRVVRPTQVLSDTHVSETSFQALTVDDTLYNDGSVERLWQQLQAFLERNGLV